MLRTNFELFNPRRWNDKTLNHCERTQARGLIETSLATCGQSGSINERTRHTITS